MSSLNLPPFYIGQKVVYITGLNMPKGTIDVVVAIKKSHCKCTEWMILLQANRSRAIYPKNPLATHFQCPACGEAYPVLAYNQEYWDANSFRPLEEMKFPLIKYSKVLEEQLVSSN